jgi:2-(1,2-epoxy-1,2-dihydrophenyl)acetyl-CoA isomerase
METDLNLASSTTAAAGEVLTSIRDSVATVTINRPERRNALTAAALGVLRSALGEVAADPIVRVVVVTGQGHDFSVGGDLGVPRSDRVVTRTSHDVDLERVNLAAQCCRLLHEMPKPTVASIDGACAGAGMGLALGADLRIATTRSVFNTAFLSAGLSGDSGLVWNLTRIVGSGRARELCLLPDKIDAATAERIGLVSRLVEQADLDPTVAGVAERLASSAPVAVRGIKANLTMAGWAPLDRYLVEEAERMIQTSMTSDSDEAAAAYLARRPPEFTGR